MQPADLKQQWREWRKAALGNRLFAPVISGAAAIALVDQASKLWIVHGLRLPSRHNGHIEISALFDLTYVENLGASFGLLAGAQGARALFILVSLLVSGFLISWLARLQRPLAALAVAFIVGGAIGNLVDRIYLGYVVDFLNFSGVPFPGLERADGFPGFKIYNQGFIWVFNVADVAINAGIGVLALDWLMEGRKAPAAR